MSDKSKVWIVVVAGAVLAALLACSAVGVVFFGTYLVADSSGDAPPAAPAAPINAPQPAAEDPRVACDFLLQRKLLTRGWKLQQGSTYGCASSYRQLGGSPVNNLAFYAEGTSGRVQKLWLTLNVNDPRTDSTAELLDAADELARRTTGAALPGALRTAIESKRNGESETVGSYEVAVRRVNFATGKGYSLRVTFVL